MQATMYSLQYPLERSVNKSAENILWLEEKPSYDFD